MFRYSTLAGGENAPAPAASELIEIVRHRPVWDEITVAREDAQFPRAGLSWHEGHGLVVHGGQVQERWLRQLFVDPSLGAEALDHFLETGKQKETLHWIRTDAFARETVWKGRAGREAWEKRQEKRGPT